MKRRIEFVLDASALLAFVLKEPGGDSLQRFLDRRAGISAVNWAEVLTKLADAGDDPSDAAFRIRSGEMLGSALSILPFEEVSAREAACLRTATVGHGLSLGDRACLATARLLPAAVVTADRNWSSLKLGVTVHLIRK